MIPTGVTNPPDEGTIVKRIKEDGSEEEVEIGLGLDPDTGKIGLYEEIWKQVAKLSVDSRDV